MEISRWPESESVVHQPGRWLLYTVGTIFLLAGLGGFLTIGGAVPPGFPFWMAQAGAAFFALCGGFAVAHAIRTAMWPVYVRHAAAEVLATVPREPVLREGSVVHGRVTHELVEDAGGWQFRPARPLWRDDRRFMLGFGVPFLALFSGLLSWILHTQHGVASWPASIVCATALTLLSGGSAFALIWMITRAGYRRLGGLNIPGDGAALELDAPEEPEPESADLAAGVKWVFGGDARRQRLTIPRELVQAVQLCPWKFSVGGSGSQETTWGVQGLLVLASSADEVPQRIPILLTSDFRGAARLMQELAGVLRVPYLFCADAAGWKAEELRAKQRRPLRIGGSQS